MSMPQRQQSEGTMMDSSRFYQYWTLGKVIFGPKSKNV